jgi:hypothetical protein
LSLTLRAKTGVTRENRDTRPSSDIVEYGDNDAAKRFSPDAAIVGKFDPHLCNTVDGRGKAGTGVRISSEKSGLVDGFQNMHRVRGGIRAERTTMT